LARRALRHAQSDIPQIDRRESRAPRPLHRLPDGGLRGPTKASMMSPPIFPALSTRSTINADCIQLSVIWAHNNSRTNTPGRRSNQLLDPCPADGAHSIPGLVLLDDRYGW